MATANTSRTTASGAHFSRPFFSFLSSLEKNNRREWFKAHEAAYRNDVQGPALAFVADFAAPLARVSRAYVADPKPVGGSLSRIHRDTRFGTDKRPYKTELHFRFPHKRATPESGGPFYYLRLGPKERFLAAGIKHATPATLNEVRRAIVAQAPAWKRVLSTGIRLEGESLKRMPRGFDENHPLAADLRRTEFVTSRHYSVADVTGSGFADRVATDCAQLAPLNRFLEKALGFESSG